MTSTAQTPPAYWCLARSPPGSGIFYVAIRVERRGPFRYLLEGAAEPMLDQEVCREAVIVTLPGEIDFPSQERVYDQLYAAFVSGASVVIADFTGTAFCDCSFMRRLVMVQHRAAARDAELRVVIRPGGLVHLVAELMDLDRVLPVYASTTGALSGAARRGKAPGSPCRAAGGTAAMAGIIDLREASCLHIVRWRARLGELRRRAGPAPCPEELAAAWETVATLTDLHMAAEDEICVPAISRTVPQVRPLTLELRDAHEDIREMIGETRLQSPRSPLWWQFASTALSAWAGHLDQAENGPLGDCLRRADPVLRDQLARQWRAFREARIRDLYPDAPPELPTCRLRLSRPAPPRLAEPAFSPLSCTCPACTDELARIPLLRLTRGSGTQRAWKRERAS